MNPQTSTVQTLVSPEEVAQTAGADQTNSLAMITDFTPGAYMVHDMLHMRGGHQVNWFFDGIPVVNTNIAANVAPLINPKNVEELEVERGGYSSQYGDRTYGFFNVVTPSGFERYNEGQIVLSAGNFYSTDDQLNIGSHTQRFAYYASVDGNRSELGQWRVAFSNQIAQGIGPITGGLLEDLPPGNFLLDHDQRNTVTSVLSLTLPGHAWATPAYQFGSGFLNGNGPVHLPPHSTFDLFNRKNIRGEVDCFRQRRQHRQLRYLLDTSNTFGGTH